jgi:AsmA protein
VRKLVVGVLGVLLLAVAVVLAVLLVPSPLQRWAVERGATLATGREVTIGGPFQLSLLPPASVTATDVRVANASWGKAPELARIGSLDARIDLLAYWREGRVKVDRLVVSQPLANLEVAEDGQRNWDLGDLSAPAAEPGENGGGIPGFVLGDIRIEGGSVIFDDRQSKRSRSVDGIELKIAQAAADQPVTIEGGATMSGQRATVAGKVDRAQGVAAGETSPITVDLTLPGATVGYDGTINTAAPAASGVAEVELTDPRGLLAWLGRDASLPDGALRSARVRTRLEVTSDRVALDDLDLKVDAIEGRGTATAALTDPPSVQADLTLGRVDLAPYLPPETAMAGPEPAESATAGWPDDPIALPLPLPVDLDARVKGDGVKAGKVEIAAYDLRVHADRAQALFTIDGLQAYGGALTGKLQAGAGSPPAYAVDLAGNGIGVLAASEALTGLSRFDGRAEVELALASRGASVRDLVGALNGDGRVILRDGAVLGINIAGMLRQIMTLGLDTSATQQQRTDFAEAGASFQVESGIVRTQDLRLNAPVLRLEGAGAVDLPKRTIDMRVEPRLASTLQGQDASGEPVFQAGIPFLVQGPYTSPAVRFDLNGTLTSAISGPEDVARLAADLAKTPEAVNAIREQFDLLKELPVPAAGKAVDAIKGVLGDGGSDKGKKQPSAPDLGKAAKGLLQGLTGQ